jgi:glycosyltransferase involved in cell wall biosynthesis
MNVVHVVVSGAFAGVEAHVARLARTQAAHGHRVTVVGGAAGRAREATGSAVTLLPGATLREAATSLARVRGDADVLHAHMTAAELVAVGAARGGRLPVVATRHFAQRRGRSVPGRLVARVVAPRISVQIAISRYVADAVDGPSVVVHPGVDTVPDILRAARRDAVVLLVQRLEPEKRTDLGLQAFAASGLAAQGWRLDVVGDGALRGSLEALVARSGMADHVRFLGTRRDVATLMARAGILLAPCPAEGLGLSVLEAMAAGLPVVAAGAGGHVETLGGLDLAALYAPSEPADGGRRLVELATSPGRRDALAVAARARQRERYAPEAQARATEAVYRSVL